ncbi:hypothetical protein [Bacillus alkalicola]|uniref:Uncharacterized protein n=1 Tax=Evansella alkalicola TaxID=745819 RepID=A0ABS6JT03_9BACI|nr:hypothetical protein [Bacillus alkalicola]MBU9721706.1 hypothetical protein [Bacillus alkalicola]
MIRYEKEEIPNLIPDRGLIRYEKEEIANLIPDRGLIWYLYALDFPPIATDNDFR